MREDFDASTERCSGTTLPTITTDHHPHPPLPCAIPHFFAVGVRTP